MLPRYAAYFRNQANQIDRGMILNANITQAINDGRILLESTVEGAAIYAAKVLVRQTAADNLEHLSIKMIERSEEQKQKLSIQRFKGLGEMNPKELWQTTLDPENRPLLKVQYSKGTKEKSKEDQKIIEILMGDDVAPRKDFITSNALEVDNLDI